ncbi:sporulation protein [Erythrobacter aquimaris]|uniref:Sporulation protein n=1 Tax=Qipengyuania aquimaris TaxID=255984 RepID=A0A6I4TIG1_9SPHN|nr:SPOR domain-containing protein [Qipengyuania aquimaris]MXO94950.1 sporulation protein [Qipengyuania aquimaris]
MKLRESTSAVALLCMVLAVPAQADVKAGVDAWTAGNFAAAVEEWKGPAVQGDPDAQFNLAQAYRLGRGVEADLGRAEALYAQAAASGHIRAADQYGLLLFQTGQREQAMPYIEAAAGRGEPRAQYLLGIAHFNGDLAAKDWPRAYALLTLANGAGMPQAAGALAQMDEYIPLEQRQQAQPLAASLKAEAEATRARELTAVDLALGKPPTAGDAPQVVEKPQPVTVAKAEPTSTPAPIARAVQPKPPAPRKTAHEATGPWKVQLGAFGVPGNSERLWSRISSRGEIAGRERIERKAGNLTILLAGGYASKQEASAACASLKRSGQECLVTR